MSTDHRKRFRAALSVPKVEQPGETPRKIGRARDPAGASAARGRPEAQIGAAAWESHFHRRARSGKFRRGASPTFRGGPLAGRRASFLLAGKIGAALLFFARPLAGRKLALSAGRRGAMFASGGSCWCRAAVMIWGCVVC